MSPEAAAGASMKNSAEPEALTEASASSVTPRPRERENSRSGMNRSETSGSNEPSKRAVVWPVRRPPREKVDVEAGRGEGERSRRAAAESAAVERAREKAAARVRRKGRRRAVRFIPNILP